LGEEICSSIRLCRNGAAMAAFASVAWSFSSRAVLCCLYGAVDTPERRAARGRRLKIGFF